MAKIVENDATIGGPASVEGATKLEKPAKVKKVKEPKPAKTKAIRMSHAWGEAFSKGLNKEEVVAYMTERFPQAAERIQKWVTWYKNFYNMGKIEGFETPTKVEWPTEKSAEREAKKAEKLAAKEQARAVKQAQKEAAKAEKQAAKSAKQEADRPAVATK